MNRRMPSRRGNRHLPYCRQTERSALVSSDLAASLRERGRIIWSLVSAAPEIYTPAVETAYFPYLLWNVVENDSHRCIWWSADGTAVVVYERMFISEILNRDGIDHIFGTSSIEDFYRQLDLYGFRTATFVHENDRHPSGMVISAEQVKVFIHRCFTRNARHHLAEMRRREVAKAAETAPVTEPVLRSLVPSQRLAPSLGLTSQEALVLDQAQAFLSQDRVVQALQPVLLQGRTLLDPETLGLTILLATLCSPSFIGMDDSTSTAPSD